MVHKKDSRLQEVYVCEYRHSPRTRTGLPS